MGNHGIQAQLFGLDKNLTNKALAGLVLSRFLIMGFDMMVFLELQALDSLYQHRRGSL